MATERDTRAQQSLASTVPDNEHERSSQKAKKIFAPSLVPCENNLGVIPAGRRHKVAQLVAQVKLINQDAIEDHTIAGVLSVEWWNVIDFVTYTQRSPRPVVIQRVKIVARHLNRRSFSQRGKPARAGLSNDICLRLFQNLVLIHRR